jgi:transcriptional regulator with XRE-family HTH domain
MEHLGRIIGENLKRLRSENELSLDALAKQSGVSKSRLGQIERGEANPSIATLWQIANALKVEFSMLVTAPRAESVVVHVADVEPITADDGRYRVFAVFPFDPTLGYEVFRAELEPGGRSDAVRHAGAVYETITIASGELSMRTGGEEHVLRPGDAMRFKADAPHEYRNDSDEIAVFDTIIAYPRSS